MREILFRGQRVDTKEWVTGCLITSFSDKTYIGYFDEGCSGRADEVIPETVGQLVYEDDYGNKFFEDDIIKHYDSCGNRFIISKIKYIDSCYCGQDEFKIDCSIDVLRDFAKGQEQYLEVISNIHDAKPEQLKEWGLSE